MNTNCSAERRDAVPPAPHPTAGSPLQIPVYRNVWIASIASNFGGLIQSVGAAWMMTMLGGSAQQIALVQAATTLPILLLALWAGAVADNLDRRKVMLAAQSAMFVMSAVLAGFAWAGWLSPVLLLVFTFAIACGTAINGPAWQASVGDMVPRTLLPQAISLNAMGFNIARSTGPAIGGIIVATAGAASAFLINAVSYLALIGVLLRWRPDLPERTLPRERLGMAMSAGLRYIVMSPNILSVLVRAALFGIGATAIPSLLPVVARDLIGGGALTYGVLFGGFGLGAVIAALMIGAIRRRVSPEGLVRIGALTMAAGAAGTSESNLAAATFVAMALAGFGWVLALATFNVIIQLASPRWVVARTLALYQMAAFGGMAGGSWLFGALASLHGVGEALGVASVLLVLVMVLGLRMPLPDPGGRALDPLGGWTAPDTTLPIQPRSGPIKISIEHRISEGDVPRFLGLMNERRRIRLRDGASNWLLLRDLADVELWLERFDFPTWLDYLRHNDRRTTADAENQQMLRDIRIGEVEPVVHRMIERSVATLTSIDAGARDASEPMTDPTRAT